MPHKKTARHRLFPALLLFLALTPLAGAGEGLPDLGGTWDFVWEELRFPGDFSAPGVDDPMMGSIVLPGYWSSQGWPAHGYATYRKRVALPQDGRIYALQMTEVLTAWSMYLDGHLVASAGAVGKDAENSEPQTGTRLVFFSPRKEVTEIIIQVSNFHYRKGGLLEPPQLDLADRALGRQTTHMIGEILVLGGLLIMALYHIGIAMIRRNELSALWFGLFCGAVLLRFLATGSYVLGWILPHFPWEVAKRFEFFIFTGGNIPFQLFLISLFPRHIPRKTRTAMLWTSGILGVVMLALPTRWANLFVVPLEIWVVAVSLFYLVGTLRAVMAKERGARTLVGGVVILLMGVINDILYANQLIAGGYVLQITFFVVILSQAFLLSRSYNDSYRRVEALTGDLSDTNASLRRFIPHEFLTLLGKENIREISLGDQVEGEMAVMFSDIRRFSAISEKLTSAETFSLLNAYYGRVGHIIRGKHGFIDKYLGDGILALFPRSPDDALEAAVELQRGVAEYNVTRLQKGRMPLDVGTGIHFGPMSLGTIGELGRMDTTVIADAVNIASRMEMLTKAYGMGTIVALSFLDQLRSPESFHWRYLGMIRVQGRQEPLEAVHVYDGLPQDQWEAFENHKPRFEEALSLYRNGDLKGALEGFDEVRRLHPQDLAAKTYFQRIQFLYETGLPEDWDGIESGPVK